METRFLLQKNRPRLLLFLSGWGMDPHPFRDLSSKDYDVLLGFDFCSPRPLPPLEGYEEVTVLAWSLGVWQALTLGAELSASRWVFLNGTGAFRHRDWGIPPKIFDRTLKALKTRGEETLLAFYTNMFQGEEPQHLKYFLDHRPKRSLENLVTELEIFSHGPVPWPCKAIKAVALVGTRDRIVPSKAQEAFWRRAGLLVLKRPWGHFPFYRFRSFDDLLQEAYANS